MEFDGRPYWKPRDLASLLDVSPSSIYRMIDRGEIEHRKIGERTVRIPAQAVAVLLGAEVPVTAPTASEERVDLHERERRFSERTGLSPGAFIEAWRAGEIADTPEHAGDAMEALALREVLLGVPA